MFTERHLYRITEVSFSNEQGALCISEFTHRVTNGNLSNIMLHSVSQMSLSDVVRVEAFVQNDFILLFKRKDMNVFYLLLFQ